MSDDAPHRAASLEDPTARTAGPPPSAPSRSAGGARPFPLPGGSFDPETFSQRIRHEWDAVAAEWGKESWRAYVEASAGGVSERLLEMAAVGSGHRVLDLGTGVGEPAGLAARRVGADGYVAGIDLAPRMIEFGRRRMERLGLSQVELQVGDASRPDFPPESFDAAVSRWVLMLLPDLPAALRRIRELLVPGGRLAVGLWGHPARVPMISHALAVAAELLHLPPEPPGAPTHLWDRGSEAFADLLREAGFEDVEHDTVDVVFEWQTPADYADFITAMAGPLRVATQALPQPLSQRLRQGLEEIAARHAQRGGREGDGEGMGDREGPLRMANETLCIAGRKPV